MTTHDNGGAMAPSHNRALVVLPTYNEAGNIRRLLDELVDHPSIDVLVVDDGSPDGTAEIALATGRENVSRIHVIQRGCKLGLGTAYVIGFNWALERDYTHIIQMDADFSHDPAVLPALLEAAQRADVVLGSRYIDGGATVDWSPLRRLISRSGSAYARAILGLRINDLTGGFKCFKRCVLEDIDLGSISSTGYAFQIEMTWRAARLGYRIVEIPIVFADRREGASKMSASIVAEAVFRVLALRLESVTAAAAHDALPGVPPLSARAVPVSIRRRIP